MTVGTTPSPLDDADPLCRLGAPELAAAYRSGELSPVEVAAATLSRAEAVHRRLNVFVHILHDSAIAEAKASEGRWRAGAPLSVVDGVPTTIKDIVWVRGVGVTYGTAAADPVVAAEDAPAVARLRAAGCVIIGTTITPEFGWKALTDSPAFGLTRNPHDPALTPGGSSGGAAAAAAAGAGVFHLGTDGGGSIRIPASFTGVVGHKPTFGRVPAYPASAFGTVAHIGPMARTVADTAAMLAAMSGSDLRDWYQPPGVLPPLEGPALTLKGLRIGCWRRPPVGSVAPAVETLFDQAAARLADAGAELEPVTLPGEDLHALFQIFWFTGAAGRLAALDPARLDAVDKGLRDIAAAGRGVTAVEMVRAAQRRAEFGRAMDELFRRHDVLISPAVAVPPFEAGLEVPEGSGQKRWTEWAGFSFPINLSQQPAAVIPAGRTVDGRPVGLQIIGPRGHDGRVLAAAAGFEPLVAG